MTGAGIHPLNAAAWAAALEGAADVPPAALPEVAAALATGFPGAHAQAFLVEEPRGATLLSAVVSPGVLGPSIEALPYSLACGPITLAGSPGPTDVHALRRELGAQRVAVSIHHASAAQPAAPGGSTTHVVDLAAGRPRPRQLARRKLRAAARAGVEIRHAGPGATEALLPILAAAAAERPHYPSDVVAAVANCSSALVVVAAHEGRDVSAGLFLRSALEVFYWLGGTLPEAERLSPSYVVIDAAMAAAVEHGCRWVDLGSSDGLPGVAFFKEGFGAAAVPSAVVTAESRRHAVVAGVRRRIGR